MAYDAPTPGSLKRKRRRREDKPAISARFVLDSTLQGEVGVLSEDLIADLFPQGVPDPDENGYQQEIYVAVTPWVPQAVAAESTWIIIPINPSRTWNDKTLQNSSIRLPASSLSTQSFVNLVHALSPNRTLRQNAAVEVRVVDVVPLLLETVYVSVDVEALQQLDEIRKRYGGTSTPNGSLGRKLGRRIATEEMEVAQAEADERRRQLVEEALSSVSVVHTGDSLPLSLKHPVTHNPAPPAKILACEPVAQGLLGPSTRIVLTPATERYVPGAGNRSLLSPRLPEETEEEDTANEAYFSATDSPARPVVTSKSATDLSNSEDFDSQAEDSQLSDDDDEMISLAKPGIMDAPTGLSSAITSATPRPFGGLTGIATPGSVFSHISSSTVRGGQAAGRSRVFRAQPLVKPILEEQLYPKPGSDEDEEARVYVDSTTLAKLGCFSGDWVKIEASQSHMLPQLSAFAGLDGVAEQEWRPAKVYGLPESLSKRPNRYQVNARGGRRDSISSFMPSVSSAMTMYVSPILLANLDNPSHVSVSMLTLKRTSQKRGASGAPTSPSSQTPPVASEVTLRKVVTPLSTERAVSSMLFSNLKEYMERKQRIVMDGDIIAIPIDEALARSLYQGEADQEDDGAGALYRWSARSVTTGSNPSSVAWFTVESVKTPSGSDDESYETSDFWGGAAIIDPSTTAVRQSGDDRRRLPSTSVNTWQYYLGLRKLAPKAVGSQGLPEAPQPYVSSLQRRMRELISISISPRAVHLGLPPIAILLTSTHRGIGKAYTAEAVCMDLGIHYFAIDAFDMASEGQGVDVQSQGLFEARCARALECGGDCTAICVRHLEQLNSERIATSLKDVLSKARVLIATTTDVDKIPDSIRGLFTHELEMSAPDEGEREGILRESLTQTGTLTGMDVELSNIAVKTAALVAGDLVDVVVRAVVAKAERLEKLARGATKQIGQSVTIKDIKLSGGPAATSIVTSDFDAAVDLARKNFADSIGAPKIPNVTWDDVGGLSHVKDAVIETIQLPLSRPELFAKGLKKRSGILFYGPPGTGKTLLAKAIATEFSLNFFSVKGPELLNMYIGESEANVRRVFQRARDARPCCVFFDELDSVAPKRGNQGDSGGVMDRIVSQLLAELDGMSDDGDGGGGVFVIGATNRPDLLDQALLRPGRFDKMLYLGISDTHEKQATILQALTRKFTLDRSLSLPRVASNLPFTYTGADLYALCSDAMLKAITRSARAVDSKVAAINAMRLARGQDKISIAHYFDHFAEEEDTQVAVVEEDFEQAKAELAPSVSLDELKHYEKVRDSFEGAAKPTTNGSADMKQDGATPSPTRSKESINAALKARRAAFKNRAPPVPVNGGDVIRDFAAAVRSPISSHDSDSEREGDDFVVRTDKLSIDSAGPRSPVKGKGKGKAREMQTLTSPVNADGEDLYD